MIFAITLITAICLVIWVLAVGMFPKMPFKWKLTILIAPWIVACSLLIGLYYYGAYWTPPDATIVQPGDVYPGK